MLVDMRMDLNSVENQRRTSRATPFRNLDENLTRTRQNRGKQRKAVNPKSIERLNSNYSLDDGRWILARARQLGLP